MRRPTHRLQERATAGRRGPSLPAILFAVASAVALTGCGSAETSRGPAEPSELSPAGRLAEAWRLGMLAERARQEGDTTEAIALYRRSLAFDTGVAAIWNNYGTLLYETENRLGAIQAFQRAAEAEPSDPRHLTFVGHIYFENGWAEVALDFYERALAIDRNHLPGLRGAVRSAEALGRATSADLERIRRALLIEQDDRYRNFFLRRQTIVKNRIESERRAARSGDDA